MTASFDRERSDAIREMLIERAAEAHPRKRLLWAGALVLSGALAGAGATSAAFAASGAHPPQLVAQRPAQTVEMPSTPPERDAGAEPADGEAIEAPPGTIPGAPLISLLGEPVVQRVGEKTRIPLRAPRAATHVRVTIIPLSSGSVDWGTDPEGRNPSASFGDVDISSGTSKTWYDFPLAHKVDALFLTPSPGFSARVELQYLSYIPTRLGVNDRGETYGVSDGPQGDPVLTAVAGVGDDGAPVQGYVRSEMLDAFSPDHPGQPNGPDEAIAWQKERDEKYPDGWNIPVYKFDGVTRIGTFHVGN